MDASKPLPVVQTSSSSLTMTQSLSAQPGLTSTATLQVPPVSTMMHLQHFNLQQTLLLQQYALSQQAVSKAVKSPAEVAAARAAEISKQLEGGGGAEKKTLERSKSRSTSKSASRSPSRSKSKSRSPSRSPVKRRRGRSRSFSPIRYRRDYYPSYRSRDHYGYRGHNYRSYYRGNYDSSRYRYGRDHDYNYRRRSRSRGRRRSRTRSRSPRRDRSRGKRRSPTLSPIVNKRSYRRSSKDSRKASVSPVVKRDSSRSHYTPQGSLSREAVSSVSVSSERSRSVSEEKFVSKSRSTSQDKFVGRSRSASREKFVGRSRSASREKSVGRSRSASGEKSVGRTSSLRREKSVGRSRSLSVEKSVGRSRILSREKFVGRSRSVSMEKSMGRSRSASRERFVSRSKSVSQERSMSRSRSASQERSMDKSRSVSQEKSATDYLKSRSPFTELSEDLDKNETSVSLRRQKKGSSVSQGERRASSSSLTRSLSISVDSDRYKTTLNEATTKKRHKTPEGGALNGHKYKGPTLLGKKHASEAENLEVTKSYGHGCRGRKQLRSLHAISDSDSKSDESMDDWRDDLKKVVKGQGISAKGGGDASRSEGRGEAKTLDTQMTGKGSFLTMNANAHDLGQKLITANANSVAQDDSASVRGEPLGISDKGYGHMVGYANEIDEPLEPVPPLEQPKEACDDYEEELIFEGPQPPASVAYKERKHTHEGELNCNLIIPGVDDNNADNQDKERCRSRSRDSKKYGAGSTKHERRKGKHKRHRKRHRHEVSDEDSEGARKRHRKKQKRKSDHDYKERKKRRHKHKSRLSSISADDSTSDGEMGVRNSIGKRKRGPKKRKSSKRDVSQSSTSSTSLD